MTRGVKRFPHPRVYSQPGEVTGSHTHLKTLLILRPSHHNDQIEIFVCADAWPPGHNNASQGFPKSSLNYSPTFILHFIPGTGRRRKGLQVVVRLRKGPSAIFSWEKKRKKRESKSTPEL